MPVAEGLRGVGEKPAPSLFHSDVILPRQVECIRVLRMFKVKRRGLGSSMPIPHSPENPRSMWSNPYFLRFNSVYIFFNHTTTQHISPDVILQSPPDVLLQSLLPLFNPRRPLPSLSPSSQESLAYERPQGRGGGWKDQNIEY